jgi:hypothetical protein
MGHPGYCRGGKKAIAAVKSGKKKKPPKQYYIVRLGHGRKKTEGVKHLVNPKAKDVTTYCGKYAGPTAYGMLALDLNRSNCSKCKAAARKAK